MGSRSAARAKNMTWTRSSWDGPGRRSRPCVAAVPRRTRGSGVRGSRAPKELQRRRALIAWDQFERAVALYTPKDFAGALRGPGLAVIAEMKQRTPTMGVLVEDYRPADLAHAYTDGGAAAISVLTHMAGFGGRPGHGPAARAATHPPIPPKDFTNHPHQTAQATPPRTPPSLPILPPPTEPP